MRRRARWRSRPREGRASGVYCPPRRSRGAAFSEKRREASGLEHDLVTGRRAPGSTTPTLRRKRRRPATPDAASHQDLEVSERYAAALLLPDRAEREDRIERRIGVHG